MLVASKKVDPPPRRHILSSYISASFHTSAAANSITFSWCQRARRGGIVVLARPKT